MWALLLFKYILIPGIIIFFSWKLYRYILALNTWTETIGVITGHRTSGRNTTYIIIKFETDDGTEIQFEEDSNLPLFTSLVYKTDTEISVMYSQLNPAYAIAKTTLSPIIYSAWIVFGVWALILFKVIKT